MTQQPTPHVLGIWIKLRPLMFDPSLSQMKNHAEMVETKVVGLNLELGDEYKNKPNTVKFPGQNATHLYMPIPSSCTHVVPKCAETDGTSRGDCPVSSSPHSCMFGALANTATFYGERTQEGTFKITSTLLS
ncbi:hypothetical protein E2C01_073106 [Portunus trituberculatus]|uniref:Uncharacterized protein n=1 Tax=Portunus trituberculatus TaxID=210409 RepID=A0A5B7ID61_PORTR|nr:hypothetical protein [Portunus trituberculatus]